MNTVIVPVDFSETSLNAANYAAEFCKGHYGVTLLLYHSYAKDPEGAEAEKNLNELKETLQTKHYVKGEVLVHKEENFIDGLERAVRHRNADMVIMGITGRSALAQVFVGSNTLKFADRRVCPVLIVPEHAVYKEIKNVMLASDFKDTYNNTPSVPIKSFLKDKRPRLHVVNVDPNHYVALTEGYEKEKQTLQTMFEEFKPEFYFIRLYDIDDAINMFVEEKDVDLIITIHRNHSFREKLFKRSRTKSISYHSNVPILVVNE